MASADPGPLLGGRFRLGKALSKGSQGELFLATDTKAKGADATEVVVKRLTPRGTWKSFELFEREAKVLSQLRHAGVPRHYATIEEPPGTFTLVMQYVPGENLRELAQRRRLSEVELRDILIRCLEILDYLHTRSPPVIHRDIKPSNIVRSADGRCSLVDFGGVLDHTRDKGGSTIVGTFGYMAPEQLHGQVTPAADLYSLGATMVALAGGVEPEDVPRKGLRMDLAKQLPSLEPSFRHVLEEMTETDPDKRPQRAREVVALLARAKPARTSRDERNDRALTQPPTQEIGPRKLFGDVQEPLGTLLRIGVLGFGASGWVGMLGIRLSLAIVVGILSVFAFPARKRMHGVGRELDAMLAEGQGGFVDMMKGAMARRS
jgi:serine/threonine protein kinase